MSFYNVRPTAGDSAWFTHDRFGMFIHFGLYALPARHEWVKRRERIADSAYDRYFAHFDPDLFDAQAWASAAKNAGMKYAVLTTKHHEGFCLFDSAFTDYKITNTPFGRDLVREYVDAFRAAGLKVGFYYSLLDWHHPDYVIDANHPRCADPDAALQNQGRDMHRYAAYMRNQVRELLTNYGKIDILWFDFSFPASGSDPAHGGKGNDDWESEEMVRLVRDLQPWVLIDNRLDVEGDIFTPEQIVPREWLRHPVTRERVVWESCQTFSGSWGYYRDETSWKSPKMLIDMLIQSVSLGGNLLMNVGPTARGCFDDRAEQALSAFGKWMHFNSRSIYGCTMAEPCFHAPENCRLTEREDGKRLYIHLLNYPFEYLSMENLADRMEYAQLLHDGGELPYRKNIVQTNLDITADAPGTVTFTLPVKPPDDLVPVIEIFLH